MSRNRLNDIIDEMAVEPSGPSPEPKDLEKEAMKKFFFGQTKQLGDWELSMSLQGKCPQCGELGRVHLSSFICSTHGIYTGKL